MARVRRHLSDGLASAAPRRESGRYLVAGGSGSTSTVGGPARCERRGSQRARAGLLSHSCDGAAPCRRDELLHDVWGLDFDPGSNVIEVCMRRLRSKLGDPPIETVRGLGYCFYG